MAHKVYGTAAEDSVEYSVEAGVERATSTNKVVNGRSVLALTVGLVVIFGLAFTRSTQEPASKLPSPELTASTVLPDEWPAETVAHVEGDNGPTDVEAVQPYEDSPASPEPEPNVEAGPTVENLFSDLQVVATNEYRSIANDEVSDITKYPFLSTNTALLVEPHHETTLSVLLAGAEDIDVDFEWTINGPNDYTNKLTGRENVVIFKQTGIYSLELVGTAETDSTTSSATHHLHIFVKYVRREVRNLNEDDRARFLKAAHTLWTVSTREGRESGYSEEYVDINYLALIHNDLAGNWVCDHLHGDYGTNFINGHVALNNMFERSFQQVDPKVSLPYWDYTIESVDAENQGDLIYIWDSAIFTDAFFGSIDSATGRVVDSLWAHAAIPEVNDKFYDDTGIAVDSFYRTHSYAACFQDKDMCGAFPRVIPRVTNAYGLLRSPWNVNAEPELTRSQDLCGRTNNNQFPDCQALVSQQNALYSYMDYVETVMYSPHGSIHTFIGGSFGDCHDDYMALGNVLSADTLSDLQAKTSDIQKKKACPFNGNCTGLAQEDCWCTCGPSDDWNGITYKGHNGLQTVLETPTREEFNQSYQWQEYVRNQLGADSLSEVDGLELEDAKMVLQTICESTILNGDMLNSDAPFDPLFFLAHAAVERLYQRYALSGYLKDIDWTSDGWHQCWGHKPGYKMDWHSYTFDDDSLEPAKNLTNLEVAQILNPASDAYASAVPYIYDNFNWSHCIFSPENPAGVQRCDNEGLDDVEGFADDADPDTTGNKEACLGDDLMYGSPWLVDERRKLQKARR